jgi:citrate lyase subunit beta/citryl-CoA lyase
LRTFARSTRNLGYEGMMVIHPSHLAIVNEAFTPSAAELDEWKGIVAAMEEAEREGLGAIRLNGRLIDVAHVHTALKELARAKRLGLL